MGTLQTWMFGAGRCGKKRLFINRQSGTRLKKTSNGQGRPLFLYVSCFDLIRTIPEITVVDRRRELPHGRPKENGDDGRVGEDSQHTEETVDIAVDGVEDVEEGGQRLERSLVSISLGCSPFH